VTCGLRFALRIGAHAICEKPIVLNPWNVDALAEIEAETGRRVYTILQLRLHPAIKALKEKYDNYTGDPIDVERTYRSIRIGGEEVEFSEGFTDLHTESYRDILSGGGFGLEDARTSIEIVKAIRDKDSLTMTSNH